MNIELFDFELPEELIAQTPLKERDASRLMIVDKKSGDITHSRFKSLIEYVSPGDCLVLNDTRVMPARLYGVKEETGAKVEVLLLKEKEGNVWETLVKPSKRVKVGTTLNFGNGLLKGTCVGTLEHGGRIIEFQYEGIFWKFWISLGKCHCPHTLKSSLIIKNDIKPFIPEKLVQQLHRLQVCISQMKYSKI